MESLPGAVFSSSSRDCTTRVWKLVDNKEWGLLNLLNPHKQMADRLGISSTHYIPSDVPGFPHSALVTTAYDHTAVVQHPETSEIYYTLRGHSDAVVCATHTPQGDIVTGSVDQYAFLLFSWKVSFSGLQSPSNPLFPTSIALPTISELLLYGVMALFISV